MERGIKKGKAARKRLFALALTLAMVFTSVSVPSVTAEAAKNVKVKKIQITNPKKKKVTLVKGKTLQIKVKVTPKNAKNKKVSYKSSKKKIASVSKKGKVKGLKKGTAKITVTAKDGSKKKATLTVKVVNPVKVTKVTVSPAATTLDVGKTVALKAACAPKNATNKAVTWNTSNKGVATVTASGVVKGVAAGTAKVTATAKDGSKKSAACTVTVKAASVTPPPTPPASTKTLAGIVVTKAPTKTEYYTNEKFDPAGMEVTASYSDKSTKVLAADAYTLSPSVDTALKPSNKAVTVSYTEGGVTKTATTPIKVEAAPTVKSIAIKAGPTKTEYMEGELFDPTGMVVEATMNKGPVKVLAADTDYTYDKTPLKVTAGAEKTKFVISYKVGTKEHTAEVDILVRAQHELTSISATLKKTELERENACFTDDDITVTAHFNGAEDAVISVADCIVDPAKFTKGTTSAKITYWYGGDSKEVTVNGFTVTTYREGYTFEDINTVGIPVRRANGSGDAVPTEDNAKDAVSEDDFVNGVEGKALKMDGTYGLRLDNIAGSSAAKNYSISAWFKPEAMVKNQALIISTANKFGLTDNLPETWCAIAGNDPSGNFDKKLKVWWYDPENKHTTAIRTASPIDIGTNAEWNHVALVVDDSGEAEENYATATFYLNGRKVGSGKVRNEKNELMKTYVGVTGWTADGYYKGLVDELVFTSDILTQDAVEEYYLEGVENSGKQFSKLTQVSADNGTEVEVEYGTSLADVKRELVKIAYKATVEGSEEPLPFTTTADMWTVGGYTTESTGEAEATVKLQAPEGYMFNLGGKLSVTTELKATVKIKDPVTVTAVTPSQETMEVEYGTSEDAIKEALAKLTFTATTSDSSAFEIANAKSLWTLAADGDNYKATFELKDKPGYKYADGVKVEVAVTVKQPIEITALAADPATLTVDYNTSEADVKDELAKLAIQATVAAGSQAPESIANTADMWTITDYAAETAGDYTAKATATAPVGYKFADGVGEVTATVTVKPQGEHKLSSIRVTTNPRLKYIVGDSFDKTGMVVTAHYEDGQDEDVTAKATIGTAENLVLGTQEIEISYIEGGATATCKLAITTVKVEDGAAAHYGFEGNLENSVTGESAKVVNDVSLAENTTEQPNYQDDGIKGQGILFNDDKQRTGIELADKIANGKTDFTLNLWVKLKSEPINWGEVVMGTNAQKQKRLMLYAYPGSEANALEAQLSDTASQQQRLSSALVKDQWRMVTWVNNANGTKIYIDGENRPLSDGKDLVARQGIDRFIIGAGAWADYFHGSVDEVSIYDCSLSEKQVEALYDTVTPTIASVTTDEKEIELLKGDVGDNNAGIQTKLKELEIKVAMNNGTAPTFTNDTDWTLTKSDTGYTATKELAVPEGYVVKDNKKLVLTVNVIVKNATLDSIAVTKNPTKTIYIVGEKFDKTGMEVTATYTESGQTSTNVVEAFTVKDADKALATGDTAMTVSYQEGGVTKETTVAIQVMTAQDAMVATRTGYYTFDNTLENAVVKEGEQKTSAKLVVHGSLADAAEGAAASYDNSGKKGQAISLGSSEAKNIVQLDKNVASSKFTINLWVKPTKLEASRNFDAILFSTEAANTRELAILSAAYEKEGDEATSVRLYNGNSLSDGNHGGGEVKYVKSVLTEGTWTMLTWVNNGDGTMALYKDGVAEPIYTGPSGVSKLSNIYLGGCWWDDPFRGLIDEVSIFDGTALTTEQISFLKQEAEAQASE